MAQWRAIADLPGTSSAPRVARELVATLLRGWCRDELVPDAQLIVSELVTNAVQHAPGFETYELELVQHDRGVRISLADGSTIRPLVRELQHELPAGRGMRMVAALATAWGADDHEGGKRVWVEVGSSPV